MATHARTESAAKSTAIGPLTSMPRARAAPNAMPHQRRARTSCAAAKHAKAAIAAADEAASVMSRVTEPASPKNRSELASTAAEVAAASRLQNRRANANVMPSMARPPRSPGTGAPGPAEHGEPQPHYHEDRNHEPHGRDGSIAARLRRSGALGHSLPTLAAMILEAPPFSDSSAATRGLPRA